MRKFRLRDFVILFVLMFALVGYNCESNMVSVLGAMAAGDGVGYMLNKRAPGSVEGCEKAFDKLLKQFESPDETKPYSYNCFAIQRVIKQVRKELLE